MAQRAGRVRSGATFSGLLAGYERDPKNAGLQRLLHGYDKGRLARAFGRYPLRDLTEERIRDYGLAREAAGTTASLINDELKTLGRVLAWAHASGLLAVVPRIWYVREEREPAERVSLVMPGSGRIFPRGLMLAGDEWRTPVTPPRPPERPAKRLSDEILRRHLKDPRGYNQLEILRTRLRVEEDISISKSQLSRRIRNLPPQ